MCVGFSEREREEREREREREREKESERERKRKRDKGERERERDLFVCWSPLLSVPATCECISGTDLLGQFDVLPH